MQIRRWHHFADIAELQRAAALYIAEQARAAIAARGEFVFVLAGGQTPLAIYAQLAALDTEWQRWSIYFGDERCVPVGHADRNDGQARLAWLDRVPIPADRVHAIPAELGPRAGAAQYATALAGVGDFDLVLLGIGEDGHTASLFPGDVAALRADADAVAVDDAPKPPPQRVSLSAARLQRSRAVLFVAAGAGKREALRSWQRGAPIPAAGIVAPAGVDIYTDQTFS